MMMPSFSIENSYPGLMFCFGEKIVCVTKKLYIKITLVL